jgi:hypothetical protein
MDGESVAVGRRVVVTRGLYKASDSTTVEQGEVGWVIGFRGIHDAVVEFDTDEGRKSTCVPIRSLRAIYRER